MTQTLPPVLSPPLLLATDGSASARMAQALVRSIADLLRHQLGELPVSDSIVEHPSVLTVLTVQPRISKPGMRLGKKPTKDLPKNQPKQATEVTDFPPASVLTLSEEEQAKAPLTEEGLAELVKLDFPEDFPLTLQVRQGRPATEILNCARTIQAGLIAVGHRGIGGVRELLLGSVSTAIARYAPCSVLVVRTRSENPASISLNHVLLVVDNSSAVQQAIAVTRQLAAAGIQQMTLLHIQPPLNVSYLVSPFVSRSPSWQLNQSLQDAQREQGELMLQRAQAAIALPDVAIQTRLQIGDPGPTICQVAQDLNINLIILGSDSVRRSLLSPLQAMRASRRNRPASDNTPILRNTRLSVTEDYVIHYAPCPVLLCRTSDREHGR
ncbi:MAG: universal stress protein [Oscillatoriales cyanobacterium C42_A2020_001]|nr:universal stress protein [Leptolyngbyaceae cyanobacterium C42_A2020_001]